MKAPSQNTGPFLNHIFSLSHDFHFFRIIKKEGQKTHFARRCGWTAGAAAQGLCGKAGTSYRCLPLVYVLFRLQLPVLKTANNCTPPLRCHSNMICTAQSSVQRTVIYCRERDPLFSFRASGISFPTPFRAHAPHGVSDNFLGECRYCVRMNVNEHPRLQRPVITTRSSKDRTIYSKI